MTENNDEARLAAMRARQEAADEAERIANAEQHVRDAMAIQRRAKREAKDGKK